MAAVTITKVQTAGSHENTRYAVSFLGKAIGHVASYTDTRVVCTGGRRYGNAVNRTMWEFIPAEGATPAYQMNYTRRDAIVRLLTAVHYPGRENVARMLVERARL